MSTVVGYPDQRLTMPCRVVESFDDALCQLVSSMTETMYDHEGVGLAAPQVDSDLRVVLIDPSGGEEANQLTVMINPRVTWRSVEMEVGPEGCLSMPGTVLQVSRAVAVDVEYNDVMGTVHVERCDGFKARIVQHEIDHLDGILMVDRVGQLTRKLVLKGLGRNR